MALHSLLRNNYWLIKSRKRIIEVLEVFLLGRRIELVVGGARRRQRSRASLWYQSHKAERAAYMREWRKRHSSGRRRGRPRKHLVEG